MKDDIYKKIQTLKDRYRNSGFIIIGVFGSYARGEEQKDSDIDILYKLNKTFVKKYGGWGAISQLELIKDDIKKLLNISKVDLATSDSNNQTLQKVIKEELVFV